MIEPSEHTRPRIDYWTISIFLFAFLVRAWNIGADLPNLYYPDEPHHLNIAAHFGTGDLNPHDFKYPTLWNYMLAVLLAIMFVVEKLIGVIKTPLDFASAFFHTPTAYYMAARLLAAALFAFGSVALYWMGRKYYDRTVGLVAAGLLALAPSFFPYGRDATLNSAMVFFICGAIYWLQDVLDGAGRRSYIFSGLLLGLSVSSHYIAAPVVFLLPLAHFLENGSRNLSSLVVGLVMIGVGFLIGTPYFLLDYHHALSDISGMGKLHISTLGAHENNELAARPMYALLHPAEMLKNIWQFLDAHGVGLVLVLVGIFGSRGRRDKLRTLLWTLPTVILVGMLINSYHGNFPRYGLAAYVVLVVPAAIGYAFVWNKLSSLKTARWVLPAVVFGPFVASTFMMVAALREPDTRTLAKNWILQNEPAGEKIFVMNPFNCPELTMSLEQTQSLLRKTEELHHPRAAYYRALAHNHPGGGYDIYYWRRNLTQVEDLPGRTERSYEAQDTIDLNRDGLVELQRQGIRTAVVYVDPDPAVRPPWLTLMRSTYERLAVYYPDPGKMKGHAIEIYRCPR